MPAPWQDANGGEKAGEEGRHRREADSADGERGGGENVQLDLRLKQGDQTVV